MITTLIYMTLDSIYLCYWLLKNSIYGSYYLYCYFTGSIQSITEVPTNELNEIKNKIEHQDKMLEELTELLKTKKTIEETNIDKVKNLHDNENNIEQNNDNDNNLSTLIKKNQ